MIICTDAVLGYEDGVVVSGLDFTVSEGDYLCILGENGSGKSTLIKALLGLKGVKSGSIDWPGSVRAGEIGYLPQQTLVQRDFPASVREIVLSGCLAKCGMRPFYTKAEKSMAKANMERLGIDPLAKKCYRNLSGGQQQRVLLARALCAAEKIILLDEPVTGLDPKAQSELYELIAELNRQGVTVMMVSHDVNAVRYATHVLHIGRGSQLFFGTKEEYLSSRLGKSFIYTGTGEAETDTTEEKTLPPEDRESPIKEAAIGIAAAAAAANAGLIIHHVMTREKKKKNLGNKKNSSKTAKNTKTEIKPEKKPQKKQKAEKGGRRDGRNVG
ncbi:MAG: metal ABC transporter ATP-binding protein [Ruminococcus sp.]|nr:metal ABC transporter ATP-binding protein [Ruminococcus sp.]